MIYVIVSDDDGRTVDGPAKLTKAAFEKGIREGRRGKGNIYIWASGNGGKVGIYIYFHHLIHFILLNRFESSKRGEMDC